MVRRATPASRRGVAQQWRNVWRPVPGVSPPAAWCGRRSAGHERWPEAGCGLAPERARRGAGAWPGGPECRAEPGRQPRVTVLPPFALLDAHEPTVTCDVGAVPPHDFPNAQARGRGRHAHHAMAGGGALSGVGF